MQQSPQRKHPYRDWETEKSIDQQIEEIQTKIDELNNSVDLIVLNSL